nr:MAG TPA_asm: hypothetical protein [Caudoviricetes sp.]
MREARLPRRKPKRKTNLAPVRSAHYEARAAGGRGKEPAPP